MAEWPKWRCMNPDHHPEGYNAEGQSCYDCPDSLTEVIPADLGRELYEALKATEREFDPSRIVKALARYEREVGDG